ncbi:antirestriction protein ArdA [Gordonia iterans]
MNEKQPQPQQQPEEPEKRQDAPGAGNPNEPWARHEEVGDIYSAEIAENGRIERADKLTLRPQVWIGCLAAYNNGRLHGDWVDAAVESDELYESVQRILASSPEPDAEEWGIFDSDEFGSYRVHEYDQLEQVARVARGIAEHGPAFAAWAELHDGDEGMLDNFENAYCGAYDSEQAWADEVVDSTELEATLDQHVTGWLRGHVTIDYAGIARDLELSGEVHIEPNPAGGIWVFDTRT